DRGCYFDIKAEYAKAAPDDVLIRITATNRGPDAAPLHLLPTLWLRNTWAWGRHGDGYDPKGTIERLGAASLRIEHPTLGRFRLECEGLPQLLFTDNETNTERLFDTPSSSTYTKDAFHRRIVNGDDQAVNHEGRGTKAAAWYRHDIPAGEAWTLRLRLT